MAQALEFGVVGFGRMARAIVAMRRGLSGHAPGADAAAARARREGRVRAILPPHGLGGAR